MAGFWHHKAVYAGFGNHETLLNVYNKNGEVIRLDKWPYATESAEAVFSDELVHPLNGPEVSDSRRPPYKENVYSFQYGPVKFIIFNNNYWASGKEEDWLTAKKFGGAPEGYIMQDQLNWIKKELEAGEKNSSVKYIILSAQEAIFPNGGHVKDSTWFSGNNTAKAYTYDEDSGTLLPESMGMLEVRNELVKTISKYKKVAAVLGGDEHSYHKTLITGEVPIGNPSIDPKDDNGLICTDPDKCSPLADIKHPKWYIVSGGAGASYYSEEPTPWNQFWKSNPDKCPDKTGKTGCYYYTSQENISIFKADANKISLTVYNPYGEIIDKIP